MISNLKQKLHNKKGFTLAELLVVVAIIAVLVAIAIPIFTSQLEKARESTDAANLRAAYAEIMADAITNEGTANTIYVDVKQTVAGWATGTDIDFADNFKVEETTNDKKTKWVVSVVTDDNGYVTGAKATIQ